MGAGNAPDRMPTNFKPQVAIVSPRQRSSQFHFKQFRVGQARAAMRITTHACILGAWAPVAACQRVLDIGSGTGLLALMLAQRCAAPIDAVEIEADAAQDARENFANSPWASRLQLHETPIQLFDSAEKYDAIVSNPPFFSGSLLNDDHKKALARHEGGLNHDELIAAIVRLLRDDGHAHVLLPVDYATAFIRFAVAAGLFLTQRLDIRSLSSKPIDRVIMSFAWRAATTIKLDCLTIHDAFPQFSAEYTRLMRDYYPHL